MKWTLVGLAAFAGLFGCDTNEPIERSEQAEQAAATDSTADPAPSIDPRDHPEWEAIVLDAVQDYRRDFGQVSGWLWITRLCVAMPPRTVRTCQLDTDHAGEVPGLSELGKIGVLFARYSYEYLDDHESAGARVGQTIVKEAYEPVPYGESDDIEYELEGPQYELDGPQEVRYIAGGLHSIFVMHRLNPSTPETDNGWIYATLVRSYGEPITDSDGPVFQPTSWELTAVGMIDSCVKCHNAVGSGRLFGPGAHSFDEPLFNAPYFR